MSLDAIRRLRMQGDRPGIVRLIVGPTPAWLPDDATVVKVPEEARPARMDWRPLVGLPVCLHQTADLPHLTAAVMDAAASVGVRFYGAALAAGGIHPCADGYDAEIRANLRKYQEMLCS